MEMSSPESMSTFCTDDTAIEYIATDDFASTKDELEANIQQSKDLLRLIREQKKSLTQMVARKESMIALNKVDVVRLREQLEKCKTTILLAIEELNEKNMKICHFIDEKTQEMYNFLMKYFPAPNIDISELASPETANFTLANLIEKLIRCWMESPNSSVDIDNTIWPPYVELLLHFDIVEHRPDDPTKICLLPYD